jgi:hypothetical protein
MFLRKQNKHETFKNVWNYIWRPLGVCIIKLVVVRLSNMPRLTQDQRVWVLWFPVQDVVYIMRKRTYFLRWMNKFVIQQLCFSFVLLATIQLYIKINQIIFDRQFLKLSNMFFNLKRWWLSKCCTDIQMLHIKIYVSPCWIQ